MRAIYKGRPVVPGDVDGDVVVVDSISFYGDVNVDTGSLIDGRIIAGKVLLARRGKGSTVGPYILYALKRRNLAPKAILLTSKSDPVLVAGAVLAEVILVDNIPEDIISMVRDGVRVRIGRDGGLEVIG